jgi:hypothetical protein
MGPIVLTIRATDDDVYVILKYILIGSMSAKADTITCPITSTAVIRLTLERAAQATSVVPCPPPYSPLRGRIRVIVVPLVAEPMEPIFVVVGDEVTSPIGVGIGGVVAVDSELDGEWCNAIKSARDDLGVDRGCIRSLASLVMRQGCGRKDQPNKYRE